jgi:hypothetical protein
VDVELGCEWPWQKGSAPTGESYEKSASVGHALDERTAHLSEVVETNALVQSSALGCGTARAARDLRKFMPASEICVLPHSGALSGLAIVSTDASNVQRNEGRGLTPPSSITTSCTRAVGTQHVHAQRTTSSGEKSQAINIAPRPIALSRTCSWSSPSWITNAERSGRAQMSDVDEVHDDVKQRASASRFEQTEKSHG